jgi:thioredoxin 1
MIPEEGTVLVDFYADWCHNCASVDPMLTELEGADVKVVRVNIEEDKSFMDYGVMSIPTLIRFQDGKETHRVVGAGPKDAMLSELGFTQ